MGKVVDRSGKPFRPDKNKRHEVLANAAMADLVARVQNLEACIVMLATLAQHDMTPSCADQCNVVMEAFYTAQLARGASHLAREPTDDDPAIFV